MRVWGPFERLTAGYLMVFVLQRIVDQTENCITICLPVAQYFGVRLMVPKLQLCNRSIDIFWEID